MFAIKNQREHKLSKDDASRHFESLELRGLEPSFPHEATIRWISALPVAVMVGDEVLPGENVRYGFERFVVEGEAVDVGAVEALVIRRLYVQVPGTPLLHIRDLEFIFHLCRYFTAFSLLAGLLKLGEVVVPGAPAWSYWVMSVLLAGGFLRYSENQPDLLLRMNPVFNVLLWSFCATGFVDLDPFRGWIAWLMVGISIALLHESLPLILGRARLKEGRYWATLSKTKN